MSENSSFDTFYNTIAGQKRSSPNITQGTDPSTRKPLWSVPVATDQDLEDAVTSAQQAFPAWSQTPWAERQRLLSSAHEILLSNIDKMAVLLTQEGGKPIQFGGLEAQHALDFLDFNAKHEPIPEKVILENDQIRLSQRYLPLGVVAAISPWNYPLVLAMGKIAASLVTGNCVIVKPSPYTPYSALKFVELVQHLFPPGVLQALNGDDSLGPKLCNHDGIQKISFTGSTATGKKIAAAAAKSLKRVTLELGGNNACIVCADVNPSAVGPQVAVGAFFNSGQLCVASKRIYVHKDIYDDFLKAMVDTVKSWKVGPTSELQKGMTLGPIQNEMQYATVKRVFDDTAERGFKFAVGSKFDENPANLVVQPAIIENPPDESMVVAFEAFGPIVPVLSWSDEDEVIKRANDSTSGLGAAIWSNDISRAERLGARLEAGSIWINSFEKPLPQGYLSGWKESGAGGEWGSDGLLSYCMPQTIHHYKTGKPPGQA